MGTKEQWSLAVVSLTLSWTPMPAVWGGGLKGGGTMSWPLPSVPVGTEARRLRACVPPPLGPFVENPLPCLELWDVGSFSLLSTPSVPSLSCAVASLPERS